jgi:uncharacterized protein (DUF362 family)
MIRAATYDSVRDAVDEAFACFPMNLQGKKVLIKPNVLRASEAAEGIVTHPAVLTAVVEKMEECNEDRFCCVLFSGGIHPPCCRSDRRIAERA